MTISRFLYLKPRVMGFIPLSHCPGGAQSSPDSMVLFMPGCVGQTPGETLTLAKGTWCQRPPCILRSKPTFFILFLQMLVGVRKLLWSKSWFPIDFGSSWDNSGSKPWFPVGFGLKLGKDAALGFQYWVTAGEHLKLYQRCCENKLVWDVTETAFAGPVHVAVTLLELWGFSTWHPAPPKKQLFWNDNLQCWAYAQEKEDHNHRDKDQE